MPNAHFGHGYRVVHLTLQTATASASASVSRRLKIMLGKELSDVGDSKSRQERLPKKKTVALT